MQRHKRKNTSHINSLVTCKVVALAISLACFVGAGCDRDATAGKPSATTEPLSLNLLDGAVAEDITIHIGGRDVQATMFSKDLGQSALFMWFYPLPSAAEGKREREVAINEEIDRCVANSRA